MLSFNLTRPTHRLLASGAAIGLGAVAGCMLGESAPLALGLADAVGGIGGNLLSDWLASSLGQRLPDAKELFHNQDLQQLVGDCIGKKLESVANDSSLTKTDRGALKKFARQFPKIWMKQQFEESLADVSHALSDVRLVFLDAQNARDYGQVRTLDVNTWSQLLAELDAGQQLSEAVRTRAAGVLHAEFAAGMHELLKADYARHGKAYAGFQLLAMGELLNALREFRKAAESTLQAQHEQVCQQIVEVAKRQKLWLKQVHDSLAGRQKRQQQYLGGLLDRQEAQLAELGVLLVAITTRIEERTGTILESTSAVAETTNRIDETTQATLDEVRANREFTQNTQHALAALSEQGSLLVEQLIFMNREREDLQRERGEFQTALAEKDGELQRLREIVASVYVDVRRGDKEAEQGLKDPAELQAYLIKRSEQSEEDAAADYRRIADVAYLRGDIRECEKRLDLLLARNADDVDALNRLGHVMYLRGDLKGAEDCYLRVQNFAREDSEWQAIASGNLGILFKARGDLKQAEEFYRKSLVINEELGRKEGMANQYGNLGILFETRGDLKQAEEFHRKSLAIEVELGRKVGMAIQYGNLGILFQTRGDLQQAEEFHRKSLTIEEELGRKEGMASDYGNLGNLFKTRGDLKQAEEFHRKSLAINEELGRKEGMANQYGNLGNLFETRGDLQQAEEFYRKALAINEELGRKEGMANQYGNLGILFETRGDLKQARQFWLKSRELFSQFGAAHMAERVDGWLRELDADAGE